MLDWMWLVICFKVQYEQAKSNITASQCFFAIFCVQVCWGLNEVQEGCIQAPLQEASLQVPTAYYEALLTCSSATAAITVSEEYRKKV